MTLFSRCGAGACSERVPPALVQQNICLNHYLDLAFTRVAQAFEVSRRCQPLEEETLVWLAAQGDLIVELLSNDRQTQEQRSQLLEMLLCLSKLHENLRRHPVQSAV